MLIQQLPAYEREGPSHGPGKQRQGGESTFCLFYDCPIDEPPSESEADSGRREEDYGNDGHTKAWPD